MAADAPKRGTAGYALQLLADLKRLHGPEDIKAYGVIEHGPALADFLLVIDGERWVITAERNAR